MTRRFQENYTLLDVQYGVHPSVVRKGYLRSVKQHHPDLVALGDRATLRRAEDRTKLITAAYAELK